MGFLDLFKSAPPFEDPQLGTLAWSGRHWEGRITLQEGCEIPLCLAGKPAGPDEVSLALARELPATFDGLIPAIETALFDHYGGYREAAESGEGAVPDPFPAIAAAEDVWDHVRPEGVLIEPLDGVPTVEIALAVGWDEEHTLGARLRDGALFHLNGSVAAFYAD